MDPQIVAALITGSCAIVAAGVAGIYTSSRKRAQRTKLPPMDHRPAVIPERPQAAPAVRRRQGRSAPSVWQPPSEFQSSDQSQVDGSPHRFPTQRPDDDPYTQVLPVTLPPALYQGLHGDDLTMRFLTDVQLHRKPEDKFIFDDGHENNE